MLVSNSFDYDSVLFSSRDALLDSIIRTLQSHWFLWGSQHARTTTNKGEFWAILSRKNMEI